MLLSSYSLELEGKAGTISSVDVKTYEMSYLKVNVGVWLDSENHEELFSQNVSLKWQKS